jgi:hypothetical protein
VLVYILSHSGDHKGSVHNCIKCEFGVVHGGGALSEDLGAAAAQAVQAAPAPGTDTVVDKMA